MAKGIGPLETMPVSPLARLTRGCSASLAGATAGLPLPADRVPHPVLVRGGRTPGFPITGLTTPLVRDGCSRTARSTRPCSTPCSWPVVVALLATIIGTMAAFPLVRGGIRFPGTARILFTLPIMIPGVLHRARPARVHHAARDQARPAHGDPGPPRVHDAVRGAHRGRPAPGLRSAARVGGRRSRGQRPARPCATSCCPSSPRRSSPAHCSA